MMMMIMIMMMLLLQLSAYLSLYVNKLNWMEEYYRHIQKQIISLAKFYFNNFIISHDFYIWFLIISFLLFCGLLIDIFSIMLLWCLCNQP